MRYLWAKLLFDAAYAVVLYQYTSDLFLTCAIFLSLIGSSLASYDARHRTRLTRNLYELLNRRLTWVETDFADHIVNDHRIVDINGFDFHQTVSD